MEIKKDKEWRIRKDRSARASRSTLAYKFKQSKGTFSIQSKSSKAIRNYASKEVMVKITAGAKTARGIKNTIDYISRGSELTLQDDLGKDYQSKKDNAELYDYMTTKSDKLRLDGYELKLTHNMMFSSPKIASVSSDVMLDTVRKTLKEKYPDNRFFLAYHQDMKNPHVYAVLRIPDNQGERINIRKNDLREMRTHFAAKLQALGYDVKATHKQDFSLKNLIKSEPDNLRNRYEVVDFGKTNYQFDIKNKEVPFIKYRTLKSQKEVTIWGKELQQEMIRERIMKGSLIKIKKGGVTKVKVPIFSEEGSILGYKEAKKNQWKLENLEITGIDRNVIREKEEILFDTNRQSTQLNKKREFTKNKAVILKNAINQDEEKRRFGLGFSFGKR
ncbi:MobP1 family relaxase [Candidatus Regiella endosymbiont of Tuberolachnus salignus]|uniref:MobP1 family relaxase n=1 Tax=Candidatus Regiella endosymbiont of Tuberolachnus salignus TaxID=3077956 RepID=UPI0030D4395B